MSSSSGGGDLTNALAGWRQLGRVWSRRLPARLYEVRKFRRGLVQLRRGR